MEIDLSETNQSERQFKVAPVNQQDVDEAVSCTNPSSVAHQSKYLEWAAKFGAETSPEVL